VSNEPTRLPAPFTPERAFVPFEDRYHSKGRDRKLASYLPGGKYWTGAMRASLSETVAAPSGVASDTTVHAAVAPGSARDCDPI
jgi:hypothetical protein